ncbi:MAG: exodeoxyribonuclease VII small subunit [Gammaproteobacteria bacterium]|nr:exodeoxyribonuclease VII small subunit [Gammaproteobacteria bacterium]
MAQAKPRQVDLEKSMAELEQIVEELEAGELPLDKSLKQFEKGVKISRDCQAALETAEQKLQILMGDELQDVEPDELDADE